jgi:CRP-like cAMP-binding protein
MIDRRRAAGACLYMAGTPADTFFYVKHGVVALSRGTHLANSDSAPHAIRRAGSLLGMEVIVQDAYADSAHAVTDTIVCAAGRAETLAWLEQEGTARTVLDCHVRALVADHAARATTDGSAPRRVARWLLSSTRQQMLPRVVLAGLLGMRPETLSRALAALVSAGCIVVSRSRIDIANASHLEDIANGGAA